MLHDAAELYLSKEALFVQTGGGRLGYRKNLHQPARFMSGEPSRTPPSSSSNRGRGRAARGRHGRHLEPLGGKPCQGAGARATPGTDDHVSPGWVAGRAPPL